jgi:hypothetical protein
MGGKSDLRSNVDNGLGAAGLNVATIFCMPYRYGMLETVGWERS